MSPLLMPVGPRILVKDVEPLDDLSARAKQSGIHVVVFEHNVPKPTTGLIVALGSDPEVQRLFKIGDIVFFNRFAGTETIVEGQKYRTLEFHEVTNILRQDVTEAPEGNL